MEGLVKACCNALIQEMTLESCMHIRSFARAFPFSCSRIKEAADKFLLENFAWIYCFSADFLQVDVDDLSDILKSDRLNARTEGIPLDAVCRLVNKSTSLLLSSSVLHLGSNFLFHCAGQSLSQICIVRL